MSLAKAILIGRVGKDPVTNVKGDYVITDFSVAVSEKVKGQEKTTWFKVSVFGNQGEYVKKYIKKGTLVFVEGKLTVQEYTGKDGQQKTSINVTANEVKALSFNNNKENNESADPF